MLDVDRSLGIYNTDAFFFFFFFPVLILQGEYQSIDSNVFSMCGCPKYSCGMCVLFSIFFI